MNTRVLLSVGFIIGITCAIVAQTNKVEREESAKLRLEPGRFSVSRFSGLSMLLDSATGDSWYLITPQASDNRDAKIEWISIPKRTIRAESDGRENRSALNARGNPIATCDITIGASSLEGIWQGTAVEFEGQRADGTDRNLQRAIESIRFTFSDGIVIIQSAVGLTFHNDGHVSVNKEKNVKVMKYVLHPQTKPNQIDFFSVTDDKPISLGIYSIKGQQLVLCFSDGNDARPNLFQTVRDSKEILYELRYRTPTIDK